MRPALWEPRIFLADSASPVSGSKIAALAVQSGASQVTCSPPKRPSGRTTAPSMAGPSWIRRGAANSPKRPWRFSVPWKNGMAATARSCRPGTAMPRTSR